MTDAPKNKAESLNPYQQLVSDGPVETNDQRAVRRPKPLVPPRWVWIVLAGTVALIVLVRVQNVSGDHAYVNILTLLLSFLGSCAFSLWFLFFSGYSWKVRVASLLGVFAGIALFFIAFRIKHVSGEMVPTFRSRWAPPADSLLESPREVSANERIDLTTTSEKDFPQFLGPHRNGTVLNVRLARDWDSNPPRQLWRHGCSRNCR